jgi:hypothetical protein
MKASTGTVTIFNYGAGPNGVMRTLGKYMLGSGATFGYALSLRISSLPVIPDESDVMIDHKLTETLFITECSCPSVALSVRKVHTATPGDESAAHRWSCLVNIQYGGESTRLDERESIFRFSGGLTSSLVGVASLYTKLGRSDCDAESWIQKNPTKKNSVSWWKQHHLATWKCTCT